MNDWDIVTHVNASHTGNNGSNYDSGGKHSNSSSTGTIVTDSITGSQGNLNSSNNNNNNSTDSGAAASEPPPIMLLRLVLLL